VLANRVMMGLYRDSGSEYAPDIAVVPEITVGMIPLALEVPSVEKESIKVAPGSIVVDLFVPE
jgi:hypothetical protein